MSKRKRISTEVLSGIYSITNIVNNKIYIGSSKDIYRRWVEHKNKLNQNKHRNRYLQFAWNKYGEENFSFKIIELCNEKDLFINEQKWYDFYNSGDEKYGYNLSKIARCPSYRATLDTLKNGKQTITYEQFINIIYYLENTTIAISEIAKMLNAPERTVYQIYSKKQYKELVKDKIFIKRGYNQNCILTEKQVLEIIDRLKNNEFNSDISKDYGVSSNTIDDIRHHKTWTYLTKNIEFDDISTRKRPGKSKPIIQYDLFGNFVKRWDNARRIQDELGISYKQISQVCNGNKRISHNFIWRFENDAFDKYPIDKKNWHLYVYGY